MRDALLLSVGTLTRLPVPPPRLVDRRSARGAMLLAPVIGVLLGLLAGGLVQAAAGLGGVAVPPLVLSALAVGAVAWATRGIHLDGLADTADALGSGRPPDQALDIARRSDIGPFGVMTLVLVLLVQVAAYAQVVAAGHAALGLALALGSGRLGLVVACTRGIPAARPDGLGAAVAGTVPRAATVAAGLAGIALAAAAGGLMGIPAWTAIAATVAALAMAALLVRTCVRRLGGITGDVLGAVVEAATAAALVILVLVPS